MNQCWGNSQVMAKFGLRTLNGLAPDNSNSLSHLSFAAPLLLVSHVKGELTAMSCLFQIRSHFFLPTSSNGRLTYFPIFLHRVSLGELLSSSFVKYQLYFKPRESEFLHCHAWLHPAGEEKDVDKQLQHLGEGGICPRSGICFSVVFTLGKPKRIKASSWISSCHFMACSTVCSSFL